MSRTLPIRILLIFSLRFAQLIVPALATYQIQHHRMAVAFGIGIAGYALGLLLSVGLDLPAGVAIVWAMALTDLLTAMLKRTG